MIRFDPPENRVMIESSWKNLDGLNCLEGKTLDFVEENACQATLQAHVDGGVPVITIDCGALTGRNVGQLFYFLELCCGISAYLLGVNPFCGNAEECWQRNMFRMLGKAENTQ